MGESWVRERDEDKKEEKFKDRLGKLEREKGCGSKIRRKIAIKESFISKHGFEIV